MQRITLATTLIWLAMATAVSAREESSPSPLPDAKQVKTVSVKFDHPDFKEDVEFKATLEDWTAIRATLLPAKRDLDPADWEWVGTVQIVKKNDEAFRVELYSTSRDPGAFAAGKTFKERVYYRGGKTAELVKAINAAYEHSRKREE